MTKDQIKQEETLYKSTGKLSTHPFILCSKTGQKTTMFGSNLANRIKRFGSLEKLLTQFECRASKNMGKPAKIAKVRKKRKKKIEKYEENGEVRYDIPVFKNESPKVVNLLKDEKECARLTANECWRPDLYLNGSKTCDLCILYKNCAAPIKRLSRDLLKRRQHFS